MTKYFRIAVIAMFVILFVASPADSEWAPGDRLIHSMDINGKTYNLIVHKDMEFVTYWGIILVEGEWQVPPSTRTIVAQFMIDESAEYRYPDAATALAEKLVTFNQNIAQYFGGVVMATYADEMEALIEALEIMLVTGIPEVV